MVRLLTLIVALAIAAMTLLPHPPGPPGMPGMDKLVHLLAFAALAAPLAWHHPRRWAVVALAALAYGGGIEILQPHVGRTAEWADLLADGLGAFGGAWLAARLRRARQTV